MELYNFLKRMTGKETFYSGKELKSRLRFNPISFILGRMLWYGFIHLVRTQNFRVRISGVRNIKFSEYFAYGLTGRSLCFRSRGFYVND